MLLRNKEKGSKSETVITASQTGQIRQRLYSKKHQKNTGMKKKRLATQVQLEDLVNQHKSANIPWKKLENPLFQVS